MLRKDPRSSGRTARGDLYNHGKGNKCWRLRRGKTLTPVGRAAASVTSFSALCLECVGEGPEWEACRGTRHGFSAQDRPVSPAVSARQNYCLPNGICFFFSLVIVVFCLVVWFFVCFFLLLVWVCWFFFLVGLLIWFHCFQIHSF